MNRRHSLLVVLLALPGLFLGASPLGGAPPAVPLFTIVPLRLPTGDSNPVADAIAPDGIALGFAQRPNGGLDPVCWMGGEPMVLPLPNGFPSGQVRGGNIWGRR